MPASACGMTWLRRLPCQRSVRRSRQQPTSSALGYWNARPRYQTGDRLPGSAITASAPAKMAASVARGIGAAPRHSAHTTVAATMAQARRP